MYTVSCKPLYKTDTNSRNEYMRYAFILVLLIIANISTCTASSGYWGLPTGSQIPCGATLPNDVKASTNYLKHRYTFEEQYGNTSCNVGINGCPDKASISGNCYKWLMWMNGIAGPANVSVNKIDSYFYSDNAEYSLEIIGSNLNNINMVYGSQTQQTMTPRIAISNNTVRIEQSGSVIANVQIGMYQNISGIVVSYFTNRDGAYMPGFQSRISIYVSAANTGHVFAHVQNVTRIGNPIASIPSISLNIQLPYLSELHRVSIWADQYDANLLTLSSRTRIRNCQGQCVTPTACDDAIPVVSCVKDISDNNQGFGNDVCTATVGYISRSTGSSLNCSAVFNVTQNNPGTILSGPTGVSSYAVIPGTNLALFNVTARCSRIDNIRWYIGQRCAAVSQGNVGNFKCMNATNIACDTYLATLQQNTTNTTNNNNNNNSTLPCMNCNDTLVSDVYILDSVSLNASIVIPNGMDSLVSFNVTYTTYNNTGLIINFAPNNTNSAGSCDFSAPQATNGWAVTQNYITTDNTTGATIASRSILMNITLNSLLNCTNFFGVQAFTANDLGNGTIVFSGVLGADAVYFDNVTSSTVTRFNSIFQISFTVVAAGSSQSVGFFVRQLNSVSAAWFQDSWMATPGNTITPHLVLRTSTDSDLYLANPVIINNTGIALTMISSNTQPCTISNSMCHQYWSMMGSALPSNESFTVNGYVEIKYSVCSTTNAFQCAKSIVRIRLLLSRSSKIDSNSITLNANLTMYNSTNLDSIVYNGQTIVNNCPLCALLSLNVHDADTSNFNLRVQTVELCYSAISGGSITSCSDPNAAKILLFDRQTYYVNPLYQLTFLTMPVLTKPSQSLFCFMLHIQHSSPVYLNVTWNAGYTSPGLFFVNSMLTHTFRSVRSVFSNKDLMYMKPTLHSSASVAQQIQNSDSQYGPSKYHGYSSFEFFGDGCGPHDISCPAYAYGYCFMYWCELDVTTYFMCWLLLLSFFTLFIVCCCCLYPSWIYDDFYQYSFAAAVPSTASILPTSYTKPAQHQGPNIYLNNTNNNNNTDRTRKNTSVRSGKEYNNNTSNLNSHNNRSHIDSNSHKDHSHRDINSNSHKDHSHRDINSHNHRSHIDSNSHGHTLHEASDSDDEFDPKKYRETEIPRHLLNHTTKHGKRSNKYDDDDDDDDDKHHNDTDTESTDTESTDTENDSVSESEEEEDNDTIYESRSKRSNNNTRKNNYMDDYGGDDSILEKIKGYFSKKQKKY